MCKASYGRLWRIRRAASGLLAVATILACTQSAPSLAQFQIVQIAQHLPEPRDLRSSAASAAGQGRVLLVLFSETGCPWCERLRREYLLPMQINAGVQKKVMFFQVDVDAGTRLLV